MVQIAENIITKCGGAQVVADWLGLKVSAVHRWKYPPERGGTGGLVPSNRQQDLLEKARANGVDLTPDDFFAIPADDAGLRPAPSEAISGDAA